MSLNFTLSEIVAFGYVANEVCSDAFDHSQHKKMKTTEARPKCAGLAPSDSTLAHGMSIKIK